MYSTTDYRWLPRSFDEFDTLCKTFRVTLEGQLFRAQSQDRERGVKLDFPISLPPSVVAFYEQFDGFSMRFDDSDEPDENFAVRIFRRREIPLETLRFQDYQKKTFDEESDRWVPLGKLGSATIVLDSASKNDEGEMKVWLSSTELPMSFMPVIASNFNVGLRRLFRMMIRYEKHPILGTALSESSDSASYYHDSALHEISNGNFDRGLTLLLRAMSYRRRDNDGFRKDLSMIKSLPVTSLADEFLVFLLERMETARTVADRIGVYGGMGFDWMNVQKLPEPAIIRPEIFRSLFRRFRRVSLFSGAYFPKPYERSGARLILFPSSNAVQEFPYFYHFANALSGVSPEYLLIGVLGSPPVVDLIFLNDLNDEIAVAKYRPDAFGEPQLSAPIFDSHLKIFDFIDAMLGRYKNGLSPTAYD